MASDITLPCGEGIVNVRVGAVIMRDGKFLMVGNKVRPQYLYSVGGRIQFGESSEEAVVREVREETGVTMEVDRLGFVEENFFVSDIGTLSGRTIYEISFYYYMKVPEVFDPVCDSLAMDGTEEFLTWVSPEDPILYYPEFFRTELRHPVREVRHFITDDR